MIYQDKIVPVVLSSLLVISLSVSVSLSSPASVMFPCVSTLWRKVAEELRTEEDHQFIRAYSPGLQEWVEALSFYHFLRHEKIISHQDTEEQLRFTESRVTVPQAEYVLGLADLTGELMRNAINALGSGDMEVGLAYKSH